MKKEMINNRMKAIALILIIAGFIIFLGFIVKAQGSIETEFSTSTTLPYCDIETSSIWWWNSNGLPSEDNCYYENVAEGSSNSCCPQDEVCNIGSGKCEPSSYSIEYCPDYKTEAQCESYSSNVAHADVGLKIAPLTCRSAWRDDSSGKTCDYYFSSCRCQWNSTASECESSYKFEKDCDEDITPIATCVYNTVKGNCTAGFRTTSWTATLTEGTVPEGLTCDSGTKSAKCSFSELGFFSTAGIIAVVALIIIFYAFFHKKFRRK